VSCVHRGNMCSASSSVLDVCEYTTAAALWYAGAEPQSILDLTPCFMQGLSRTAFSAYNPVVCRGVELQSILDVKHQFIRPAGRCLPGAVL